MRANNNESHNLFKLYCFALVISIGVYTFPAYSNNDSNNPLTQNMHYKYKAEEITFASGDNLLSGLLFIPDTNQPLNKAITIVGPVAYVKEQSPLLYAQQFARLGYVTVIFDPTFHGDSEGEPRRFENGDQKILDIKASVDFLESLGYVDNNQIFGVGICQGVNWMINAGNQDKRIKSISLVAGHYLTPEVAERYVGGKSAKLERIQKAEIAKQKFQQTGQVEYIPIVSKDNQDALLLARPVYDWYIPWETNQGGRDGKWTNRITRMSEAEIWNYDIGVVLKSLNKPIMMIHSNRAASGPEVPKKLFEIIPTEDKELVWLEDQHQIQFYEDSNVIERAAVHIGKWFN